MARARGWVLGALWLALLLPAPAAAAPANPRQVYTWRQPEGTAFSVRLTGDERAIRATTLDGYAVVQDPATRWWYYATAGPDGALTPSRARVGLDPPGAAAVRAVAGAPGYAPEPYRVPLRRVVAPRAPARVPGATGKLLLILVEWRTGGPANTFTVGNFTNLATQPGWAGTGSVTDYFTEVSYGHYALTVAVVGDSSGDWVDVEAIPGGNTYAYFVDNQQGMGNYPQNSQGLVEAVVQAVDAQVDFSQYDADGDGFVDGVGVIFAGTADGSNGQFWPHAWNLGDSTVLLDGVRVNNYFVSNEQNADLTQTTIGVVCHEYGHVLGLPDLYDVTNASYGVGDYCLMALGVFGGAPEGSQPSHLCAWSKAQLGWLAPESVTFGEHTAAAVEGTAQAYMVPGTLNNTTEYFLIENRQQSGFDVSLPGNGLVIYHVDGTKTSNNDRTHKLVDVECADGQDANGFDDLDLLTNTGDANDFWHAAFKNSFSPTSNPNTRLYDGSSSGIEIYAISATGAAMTFKVSVPYANQVGDRRAISYPNPFTLSLAGSIRLRSEPITEIQRIRILTLRGGLVREFTLDEIGTDGMVDWDGTNDRGQTVASGVYLLVMTDRSGNTCTGHLTLIK